ncbi:hypothetical protein FHS16_005676 [Paenibacillus endophyticus]|uniref:Polymerase/histidinol phosphatase N-terminal domain-containing protein n=1 Tax=Paenibacillus endophyticus TaxID=1294268 RepID=A0A7W5CD70_9BACL|nr:CehA/McbA family metallohydrolase [Paenibacillus endophyticus]MBB3155568.1 hypothetical protein [Paenibacillus endophyticus]
MAKEEVVIQYAIDRLVTHGEEKQYIEIPFDMPEHAMEIYVKLEVTPLGEAGATIDLGLKGPIRMRGWSGGARTEFFVSRREATPGYLPGELDAGQWAVLIGAYRIPQEGCQVSIHIQIKVDQPRWLKGDLHTHTVHSDGSYTLEEAVHIMEDLGCDFIATTDHNTVSQNFAHPNNTEVVLIPGVELTTNFGHANFLGAVDPIADFRATRLEHVYQYFHEARGNGANIVLNHTHCDYCPWEWGFNVDYDWIEVWNGPWTSRNRRALDWWHEQLTLGRRIVAIGGSDTHRPDPWVKHAMPATSVFAASRTVSGILEGIDKGHVFISCSPQGPTIEMHIGSSMIGDIVTIDEETLLNTSIKAVSTLRQLKKGDRIKIISSLGVEEEIIAEESGQLSHDWPVLNRIFYRIEIWRYSEEMDSMLLAAMSNPIYLKMNGMRKE